VSEPSPGPSNRRPNDGRHSEPLLRRNCYAPTGEVDFINELFEHNATKGEATRPRFGIYSASSCHSGMGLVAASWSTARAIIVGNAISSCTIATCTRRSCR